MDDLSNGINFMESEDLANIIRRRVKDDCAFSIIYLDLLNFREYVRSIPEEHRKVQRENALDHMRMAVVDQFVEEEVCDEPYITSTASYRAGYDKMVLCITSDIENPSILEKRLTGTIEKLVVSIESENVQLAEGLDSTHVKGRNPRLVEVKAGVVYASSYNVIVREMLTLAENLAVEAKRIHDGFGIKEYKPTPVESPQD